MNHFANRKFWASYALLPPAVKKLADQNFALLKSNPRHPSLHFKKAGRYWSARVGEKHRSLGVECRLGIVWFWIGAHSEYDRITKK